MSHTVAALYIDPRGPYPKIQETDCWDESDDARIYCGPHPVVAHPPCGPWGRLRHLSRRPEDAALFAHALETVRRVGGVIEHPAGSKAWDAYGLPKPGELADAHGGYTIEVSQVEWGHVARKRTWLYLVGVPRSALEAPPFPGREPTHWITGGRGRGPGRMHTPVPAGIKVCSAQQRRRTPPEFAAYLVRLAQAAARARESA